MANIAETHRDGVAGGVASPVPSVPIRRPSVAAGRPVARARSVPLKHETLTPNASARLDGSSSSHEHPPDATERAARLNGLDSSRICVTVNTEMRPCRSLRSQHTVSLFECVRYIVYNVYVGRRGRQREQRAQERARAPRDRMARVQVNDETWAAYRAGLGTTPVSVALGRLVEREVASHRRRTALNADGVREAVREAKSVADELENLIWRLEHAPANGSVHR